MANQIGEKNSSKKFGQFFKYFPIANYLYRKENMKIILTVDQLKKILAIESLKTPIQFKVKNLSKKDMKELAELLKKKD